MARIWTAILMSLIVTLAGADLSLAEVWRCHQWNGTDLITASEQNPGACVTFRIPDHPRPYAPNRYFPEFYYNYYPGPQSLLSREQSFPYNPQPPIEHAIPPAPQ